MVVMITRLTTLLSAALALFLVPLATRAAAEIGLPATVGMFVAKTTSGYVALERQTPTIAEEAPGSFFGHSHSALVVDRDHSPVRFRQGDELNFYLAVKDQAADPQVQFFVMRPGFHGRRVELTSTSDFLGRTSTTYQKSAVPFSATKFGAYYYVITPLRPLPPGEYFLSTKQQNDGYLFGIDAR